jgi:hypothetical protein
MHPWDRFQRKSPGEQLSEPRAIELLLFQRDKELRPARVSPGSTAKPFTLKVRNARNTAQPRPNAPLLKRLVRHPFKMYGVQGKRTAVRSPVPWAELKRDRLQSVFRAAQADRGQLIFGNPVRAYDRIPAVPALPTVDQWLASAAPAPRRAPPAGGVG